jgi:hypothetical protein
MLQLNPIKILFFVFIFFTISFKAYSQNDNKILGGAFYNHYQAKNPLKLTDFAVKGNLNQIKNNPNVFYKYSNNNWHFIRCSSELITQLSQEGSIDQIYFVPSQPQALNDSTRLYQNVDSILNGYAPLIDSFTGRNVIIGYVDTGIDWDHGDFKNDDGTTRVLRYWDQNLPFDAGRTPPKYGYGQVWTSSDINNGICTSTDNQAHGTTVTGTGSGNGKANGKFMGVAPESDIVIIETNFNLANWTLTVADAIDYVFTLADSLGKPAVVNTSVGDYLGSHDGTDPASLVIDSLLNQKAGRIVIAAAGNSGAIGNYHLKSTVTSDTSFTWFEVNPSSAFGNPAVYFDVWADSVNFMNVNFAMGADAQTPTFNFRGRTGFYNIQNIINQSQPTIDSIMSNGNKIAEVEFYTEIINGVYHMEVLINNPDSNNYLYQFMTFGQGLFDAWGGGAFGISNIKSTGLPTVGNYPNIIYYNMPDSLCTMVSSWQCSPNVITVGNYNNKKDYIDVNGNTYVFPTLIPGDLAPSSSKGPTRTGYQKPDVVATGDGSISSAPAYFVAAQPTSVVIAEGGKHMRNGGTSMASPVIAGIAALYLEKCPYATYNDFKTDLLNATFEDNYTGTTPNYGFGYGKVNAFKLLTLTNFDVTLLGDTLICDTPAEFITLENNFTSYDWSTGETTNTINVNQTDSIYVTVENNRGCKSVSDTIRVVKGTMPIPPVINIVGGGLVTTPADHYIWYFNGDSIPGANEQFFNPDSSGLYFVEVFSPEGCSMVSNNISIDVSTIKELNQNEFVVFPNPFTTNFQIIKNDFYQVELMINDINGKLVYEYVQIDSSDLFISIDVSHLEAGMYFITLKYDLSYKTFKLIKE